MVNVKKKFKNCLKKPYFLPKILVTSLFLEYVLCPKIKNYNAK